MQKPLAISFHSLTTQPCRMSDCEYRAMPSGPLPSNLPFESACYSITAKGACKLQQQRLRVFTTIKGTAATTIMHHMFYNPFCKSFEDVFFAIPLKFGTRIQEVHCQIGELAWNVPEEPFTAPHNLLRIYKLRSTIQLQQNLVVSTTIEEKVEYPPHIDACAWTLPMFMAPPYSSSLPLAYDEISVEVEVELESPWIISAIESPSHGTVDSNGGWLHVTKDERVDHKAFASFRSKDPQLKKDIVFVVLAKQRPQRLARRSPSPPSMYRRIRAKANDVDQPKPSTETNGLGGSISKAGDQDGSMRHQTSHSHDPPSSANCLSPYSPPSTPESNPIRCSAPSPDLPDPDILFNKVHHLMALQHPSDCFNGHKTSFWTLHRAVPEILSIPVSTLDSYPDLLKSRVWVTIVVIAWFEIIAQDHVYLWLEGVQRARKWLEFVKATGAVKFGGWEIEATDLFSSDEDVDN